MGHITAFKKINLGYFRVVKLYRYMRFNENRFYYSNLLEKMNKYSLLFRGGSGLSLYLDCILFNMVHPYYFFFLIRKIRCWPLSIFMVTPHFFFFYWLYCESQHTQMKNKSWHFGIVYEKQVLLDVSTF